VFGCLGDGQREQRVDALARVEGAHLGEARVHDVVHLRFRVGVRVRVRVRLNIHRDAR